MDCKISVIVPIYKVEEYLEKCVDSILNQTYRNLEVILINDGSPDNCGQICDKYLRKDKRIKVVHKENGGLSDARNAGLKIATGDYISFIDSDDYIDLCMYDEIMKLAIKYNTDIVECNINYVYEDKIEENRSIIEANVYNTEQALKELIIEGVFHQTVWNKVYKRKCIGSTVFEKGKTNEDEFWTYQVFGKAEKIAIIDKPFYYYIQRQDSIMGERYSIKRLDGLVGRFERLRYIESNYPNLLQITKEKLFFDCLYHSQCLLKTENKSEANKGYKLIKTNIKKIKFARIELNQISLKNRIWILLSRISLKYTSILRNFMKIGV